MESVPETKLNDDEIQFICLALIDRIKFYKSLILRARTRAETEKDIKRLETYDFLLHGYERTYKTMQTANKGASLIFEKNPE